MEIDAHQLPGGVSVAVVDECLVGAVGLFGQVGAGPAGAAQGAHQDGGGQGGIDVVAHGVGHRHVEGVAVVDVVECVTAEILGGFQVPAQGELRGLARQRRGQQLVLDLGREGGRSGAFAPGVKVGEAAVGDHDVGQDVGGFPERRTDRLAGTAGRNSSRSPIASHRLVTGTITRCARPVASRCSRWVRITSS